MNRFHPILLALPLLISIPTAALSQDLITVDPASVVADVSRKPIGININFLLDDDANRTNAIQSLADALKEAGVRYLRYPGGEKSDAYLWSVPPYTSSIPTLARWAAGEYPQNQEWPSYDRNLVQPDGHTFRTAPLDFDEFMTICRAIGCVPTVVVCYDSMYKPAQTGGVAPTRDQLLETAREWVRYANLTKGYKVKYWELGNESYLPQYNGSATAANYARDLIDFSRAMKAVDPTIQIGANGDGDSWWKTILSTASGAIDFLAVHNYPASTWGSYASYQNNTVDLMGAVHTAEQALSAYAPAADRARLGIATTETNSAAWSGTWPHLNDIGHALVLFDIFGAHLANPRVAFTELWNTRWSGNDTATTPALWDALDKHNELQATGRATAIWGQFLKEKLVSSSSTAKVRTYSTYAPATGKLTVFLVNKDTVVHTPTVTIKGSGAGFSVDTWVFSGPGADDLYPSWRHVGERWNGGNAVSAALPPVSITVLDLTPDAAHAVPGVIQAEDFRDGGYWDSTAGNYGNAYRATNVDIEATSDAGGGFNIGWLAAGEWLEYTIQVPAAATYELGVRAAAPSGGASFRLLVDGQDTTPNITIPATGGWQSWRTIAVPNVYLPAGPHRITISTSTGGFNLNWISASSAQTLAIPGTIQAEDFRDGGYWDSTAGNSGTAYRPTDVDIEASGDSGGGFNVGWIDRGEWLEYAVRVSTAGYYDVGVRVSSPYGGKSLAILIDGGDLTGTMSVPNTGGWQKWQTVTRANAYLAPGTHIVRLAANSDGFNLNWISFTAAAAVGKAVPGTIQAEDFNDAGFWDSTPGNSGNSYRATDVDIERTTDAGGGFNIGWIEAGEWQEYTITVAAAGYYDFSVRVASRESSRALRVLVDGADVTGSMTVPNTGAWQAWQTLTRTRIYLTAGVHQLRSMAITGGFNVNWMSLQKSP